MVSFKVCDENNLQPDDSFITKLFQAYELKQIGQGVILVGEQFTGKTTVLKVSRMFKMHCDS